MADDKDHQRALEEARRERVRVESERRRVALTHAMQEQRRRERQARE